MSFGNFIRSLLPQMHRNDVAEDARMTVSELDEKVVPSFEAAATAFSVLKLKSADVLEMVGSFNRLFKRTGQKQATFIGDIYVHLPFLKENLVYLQSLLTSEFSSSIATMAMTAKQAFILRAVCNISFMSRYSLSLLNYIYEKEAEKLNTGRDEDIEITPAELHYVEEKFDIFAKLLAMYAQNPSDFKKIVTKTPEVVLNVDLQEEITQAYGRAEVDPISMIGLSGFIDNPIYTVRMMIANWQNDRYESAKNKKQILELRLAYLEMKQQKEENPQLSREIMILQGRIEVLDRKLRDTEHSVGM